MSVTEADLLTRSAQGDAQSLDELIRQHVDLVYSTARRQVSDADAHDIVQTVFVLFSQQAPKLGSNVSVAGWLYRTTQFCCLNFRRMEARRQKHEREVAKMTSEQNPTSTREVGLLLDAALSRLRESERTAILLHYLEDKTFADMGHSLGISENAARKRANRGLQRLKNYFAERGYATVPMAQVLAVQSAVKAPPALLHIVVTAAHQPAAGMAVGNLAHAVTRHLFWSKMKYVAVSTGIFATLVVGAFVLVQAQQAVLPAQPATGPVGAAAAPVVAADPNRINVTGYVAKADLPTELPTVLWKFKSDTPLTNSVVADGKVYFADDTGQVFSINANDGSEVWRHAYSRRISVQPSLDKDQLYFGSETGITAIRRDTGELVWDRPIDHGAGEATPIPLGGRVFASGYDGNAYAFDRHTGNILWKHDFAIDAPPDSPDFPGAKARATDAVARPNGSACDGELFIQCIFDQSRVIALDCATGKQRWEFLADGWISPAPTIVNDHVYVVSQDTFLYCLDRDTGKLLWKYRSPSWLASRVAVHDGIIFLPVNGGRLIQISEKTVESIQTFQAAESTGGHPLVYSFPIVTDHACYFATGDGQLYAIGIENSDLLWKLSPGVENSELFTDPTTDGQRIFVTSRQGLNHKGEHATIAVGRKP